MGIFLETYHLSSLNHEEIDNMNRQITSKEIESVIKNLPQNKVLKQMASLVNSAKYSENSYQFFSNSSKN